MSAVGQNEDVARLTAVDTGVSVVRSERWSWETRYVAAVIAIDAAAALVASMVVLLAGAGSAGTPEAPMLLAAAVIPVWLIACSLSHGYDRHVLGFGSDEYHALTRAAVSLTAAVGFGVYVLALDLSPRFVLIAFPLCLVLSETGRYALRKLLHRLRARGQCAHSVIVVGAADQVRELVAAISRDTYHGLRVVGACLTPRDLMTKRVGAGVPVLGELEDVPDIVRLLDADVVAVASGPDTAGAPLRQLAWGLERTRAQLVVAPGLVEVAGPRLHIRPVSGLPLLHVEEPCLKGGRRLIKALFDRITAAVALIVLSPVLVAIAVAVRLTSPGAAIFHQTRIGLDGKPFTLYKFRTMVRDAETLRSGLLDRNERSDGLLFKIHEDPRVTAVGRWLRRYSIDEIPQLFNVLLGQMSLVGPRPPLPHEVDEYGDDVRRRLLVKPGVTGLWQVSGRSDLDWEQSVRLDLRYVENWSLALDLLILWKTIFAVVRGSGAY